MTILLFGVSCVGKTTIGKILAKRLSWSFFDLDEAIKSAYHTTLEAFVHTGTIAERDQKRGEVIGRIISLPGNKVIAVSPMSNRRFFAKYIRRPDTLSIELTDTPENIFERLVFSDTDDGVFQDDDYKACHRDHYLREIQEDLKWYGRVYSVVPNKYEIEGKDVETVVKTIIQTYKLLE